MNSMGAATFDIKISGNFVWFATVFFTLKEEKQNTSYIFFPQTLGNEISNIAPLSINR
jgi:hypothetical protein